MRKLAGVIFMPENRLGLSYTVASRKLVRQVPFRVVISEDIADFFL